MTDATARVVRDLMDEVRTIHHDEGPTCQTHDLCGSCQDIRQVITTALTDAEARGRAAMQDWCLTMVQELWDAEMERAKGARDHAQSISMGYLDACTEIQTAIREATPAALEGR